MTKAEKIEMMQYYCDELDIKCTDCVFDYPGTITCKLSMLDITNENEVDELYNKLPEEYK